MFMDEYNRGMEPEVKLYFRKILKSVAAVLIWFMVMTTLGFFMKMALVKDSLSWKNMVFYALVPVSLFLFIRYLIKLWRGSVDRPTA